jgi:eukaryotic-like serine/threonine-protein kinase
MPESAMGGAILTERVHATRRFEVWKGYVPPENQDVAVKRVAEGAPESGQEWRWLSREIKILTRLSANPHPNIVRIRDGQTGANPWMILEWLEGQSLASYITETLRPPLTWQETAGYLVDLTSALEHLHAHGIIHHDIKPANCLIVPGRGLVLVDFEIAEDTTDNEADGPVINGDMIHGTPGYVAPERLRGGSYELTADMYGVGATASWCLSGKHVLAITEGLSHNEAATRQLTSALPSLTDLDNHVNWPAGFVRIIDACFQHRNRPPAGTVRQILTSLLEVYSPTEGG